MSSNFNCYILPSKSGVYRIRLASMREFDSYAFAYFNSEMKRWGKACRSEEIAYLQRLSVNDPDADQGKDWEEI